jgi:hypothetical protein
MTFYMNVMRLEATESLYVLNSLELVITAWRIHELVQFSLAPPVKSRNHSTNHSNSSIHSIYCNQGYSHVYCLHQSHLGGFRMPECKERLWKLWDFRFELRLSSLVNVARIEIEVTVC